MATCGFVFLALALGWHTRLFQWLALIAIFSINGRVAQLLKEADNEKLVGQLYLWSLARLARAEEIELGKSFIDSYGDKRAEAAQDLMWAFLNSKDFMLVH